MILHVFREAESKAADEAKVPGRSAETRFKFVATHADSGMDNRIDFGGVLACGANSQPMSMGHDVRKDMQPRRLNHEATARKVFNSARATRANTYTNSGHDQPWWTVNQPEMSMMPQVQLT